MRALFLYIGLHKYLEEQLEGGFCYYVLLDANIVIFKLRSSKRYAKGGVYAYCIREANGEFRLTVVLHKLSLFHNLLSFKLQLDSGP